MASPATSGSVAVSSVDPASVIGTAFVNQYYYILHGQPENAHKFYTEDSTLARADGPTANADIITTQTKIHDKVMSLDYRNTQVLIQSVDSQYSFEGGVLVTVSGSLSNDDKGRSFVQTFFLAPQEKGYFVLNDMFRFLEDERQVEKHVVTSDLANGIDARVESHEDTEVEVPATEHVVREVVIEETSVTVVESDNSPQLTSVVEVNVEVPVEVVVEDKKGEVEERVVVIEGSQAVLEEVREVGNADGLSVDLREGAKESTASEDADGEKPSYASILAKQKAQQARSQSAAALKASEMLAGAAQSSVPLPAASASAAGQFEPTADPVQSQHQSQGAPAGDEDAAISAELIEGNARSVYIRNLPISITIPELAEEFKQFGPVKTNHIQIRGKNQINASTCFGFLEFEDVASAAAAVARGSINIKGNNVRIEEKKTTNTGFKGYNRGRGGANGRGERQYRADNPRGGRGQAFSSTSGRPSGRLPTPSGVGNASDKEKEASGYRAGRPAVAPGKAGGQQANQSAAPPSAEAGRKEGVNGSGGRGHRRGGQTGARPGAPGRGAGQAAAVAE